MGFPKKLKNMNLFGNGTSFLGEIAEVTVPKWAVKMEEWRGGGMLGPVMIDVGLDKIELDFDLGGLNPTIIKDFGATAYDASILRFAGAYQDDSTGAVSAVEITVNGRPQEIDLGNAKAGGETTHKYKIPCSYMEMVVDGVQWCQIDMIAGIFVVFGVDRYAEIRAALGV